MSKGDPVDKHFFVVALGEPAVGKTAVTFDLPGKRSYWQNSHLGQHFIFNDVIFERNDMTIKLSFWDKQQQKHPIVFLIPNVLKKVSAVLYVFSLTNEASFDRLYHWIDMVKLNNPKLIQILIGTKADLKDQRVVSRERAEELAQKLGIQYVETSAKAKHNLDKLADLLLTKLLEL